jgi:hypothetical protein
MRNELQYIRKIESYIEGKLTGTELSQLEAEIAVNQDLRMDIDLQRQLIKRINHLAAKQDLDLIHSQLYPTKPIFSSNLPHHYLLLVSVVFLLISGILLFLYLNQSKSLIAQKTSKGTIIVEEIGNANTHTHKSTEKVGNSLSLSQNKNIRYSATKVTDILYPDCEQKDKQTFHIQADKDTIVVGKKGTKIFIPSQVFVRKDGSLADNSRIKIELIELYDLSDYIKYDLPTISNGKILESGGVIYLHVTEKDEKLTIAKGKSLEIKFSGQNAQKEGMQAFYLEKKDEKPNWVMRAEDNNNPQQTSTLRSKLIENFENEELYTLDEKPKKGKKMKNKIELQALVNQRDNFSDSLIFTKQQARKMIAIPQNILRYDLYYKHIANKDMLEKLTTNLNKSQYKNTFISSIPFNERLEGIFLDDTLRFYKGKMQNESEILLKSYLDNAEKPLWVADSLAVELLKSLQEGCKANSPKSTFFRWLVAQHYTSVIQPDSHHQFWEISSNRYQSAKEFYETYGIEAGEWNKSYEFLRYKKLFSNMYKQFLSHYSKQNRFTRNYKQLLMRSALSERGHWGFVYVANWGKTIKTKIIKTQNPCLEKDELIMDAVQSLASSGSFNMNGKNTLRISYLGWINCDRFYNLPISQRTDLFVSLKNIDQNADYQPTIYAVFKNLNAVMPLVTKTYNRFYLNGLPLGAEIEIVVLWHTKEQIFYKKESLMLGKRNQVSIHLQATNNHTEVKNMLTSIQ